MDVKTIYKKIGLPRLIIGGALLIFFILAAYLGISMPQLFSDILVRFGMNVVMVLAMVPSIKAGTGLNFNLPLGIIFGLFGALVSIELKLSGWAAFFVSLAVAIPLAAIAGYLYGHMLNRLKGQEMTVGNYFGFSVVSFMCIIWLVAPFKSPELVWAIGGRGLRTTVSLESTMDGLLDNFLAFNIGKFRVPTGLLLFFGILAFILWVFNKSKSGKTMEVAGSNEQFATSNGINVNRERIKGTVISTVLGAIGIIVFSQSFGFLQLYNAPLYMAMPAIAAVLIGGASVERASISNVIIGTFLFQGLLTTALPVINIISEGSMSEIIRVIVSNGIILYALTRTGGDSQ